MVAAVEPRRLGWARPAAAGLARPAAAGLARAALVRPEVPGMARPGLPSAGLARTGLARAGVARAGIARAGVARGVDFNLENFDLSDVKRVPSQAADGSWGSEEADARVVIGGAFWDTLDGKGISSFKEEDRSLLSNIFNQNFSDRRSEGSQFVPPDTSFAHVQKLRTLVKAEEAVHQQMIEHFLSTNFKTSAPGPLFP